MGGSGSLGGNKSDSKNKSKENVWGPQGDALTQLYGSAADLFGGKSADYWDNIAADASPYMTNAAQGAQGGMSDMLSGGSYGDTSDARSMLMDSLNRSAQGGSQMGKMYESIVGGPGNTYIDPMVNAMTDSSFENLNRAKSGTAMDAAKMGQSGSSRHAMQNAMLSKEALSDIRDKEAMMRGGAYDTDLGMKMDIARMADTNVGATQDRLMRMLSGRDANVQGGVNAGSNIQNLGMGTMAPWMAAGQEPWNAMNNYAGVLGRPTVLGSSKGSGNSKGFGTGGGGGMKG